MQAQGTSWKQLTGWATLEGQWLRRKHFTPQALAQIAERIRQSEQGHSGELMVAIEAVSPAHESDSRMRTLEVFGRLQVWDTPLKTGVLLYLALDRHHIQIIADRGIAAPDGVWEKICAALRERLRRREYAAGILAAVDEIEHILAMHCPPGLAAQGGTNGLPDEPVLL